jgi:hypothetical protein
MCSLELNHIFTYKLITEDNEEEKGLKEMLYKIQLLQLFGLDELDEDVMNDKSNSLYENIKNESFVKELLLMHPYKVGLTHDELLFRTMFSYDYLDLFHRCLYNHFNKLPMKDSITKLKAEFTSK